jgi:hypothetical protein
MADPTLTGANVTFHTNDEDKDFDTEVSVQVHLRDRRTTAARLSGALAHFDDHSDHGPFDLVVVTPATREQLRTGSVTISIIPVGNDTWRFNFLLDLVFSDGSHLISRANGIELTDDKSSRTQTFGIE